MQVVAYDSFVYAEQPYNISYCVIYTLPSTKLGFYFPAVGRILRNFNSLCPLLRHVEFTGDLIRQCIHIPADFVVGDFGVNLCRGDMLMP